MHLQGGVLMANGIQSLNPDKQKRNPIGRGLRSLANKISGGIEGIRNLAPLLLGERSETGYVPNVSEAIYNTVVPDYNKEGIYPPITDQLKDAVRQIASGDPGVNIRQMRPDAEEDAWRTYLGLDQMHDTFRESQFQPTMSSGEDVRYRDYTDDRMVDALQVFDPNRHYDDMSYQEKQDFLKNQTREERAQSSLETLVKMISNYEEPFLASAEMGGDAMGTYTLDLGEDERGPYLSYYDKYDLAAPMNVNVAQISRAGNPFDIYGRLYYDPETYEYQADPETLRASSDLKLYAGHEGEPFDFTTPAYEEAYYSSPRSFKTQNTKKQKYRLING